MCRKALNWWARRRRFAEEWAFHRDMAISEFESLGMDKSDAKRLARKRLGSYYRYRGHAFRELDADFRSLLVLPWFRLRRSAFALPAAIALAISLLLIFNPLRLDVLRSVWAALPFGPAVHIDRLVPLTPPGLAPMGFATATILSAMVWAIHRVMFTRKVPSAWRVWLFGAVVLTLLLGFDAVLWATVLQTLLMTRWTNDALQGAALIVFAFVYLGWVWVTLRFCCSEFELRCPVCLRRLGMVHVRGNAQDLLVTPQETETICLHGHGSNVKSHWLQVFEPGEDLFGIGHPFRRTP